MSYSTAGQSMGCAIGLAFQSPAHSLVEQGGGLLRPNEPAPLMQNT